MSSNEKLKLKTKSVLIEICPKCGTLHMLDIVEGLIKGQKNIKCGTEIDIILAQDLNKKDKPVLCDYFVEPKEENTFTIRRWSYRERQDFYNLVGAFNQPITPGSNESMKLNIKPEIMDKGIIMSVVESPMPLKTKTDLDNTELDGAILEALYSLILDYNMPPLAQSSISRRQSTRRT